MTRSPLLAAVAATLALAGCGSDDKESSASSATPTATPAQSATPAATPEATAGGGDLTDTKVKPAIAKPTGEPPAKLVKEDIVTGKGAAAKAGDQVTVQYVGVSYSTGEQFDASWDNGQPFPFALGEGQVIPGWDKGVPGMKVGGRRKLTIPADQAYGPQGTPDGSIAPNETLIFVIDLLDVQKG